MTTATWLDASAAAALLSVSPRTLCERWALRPDFPVPMRVGGVGRPRWRQDELLEWAERQRQQNSGRKRAA